MEGNPKSVFVSEKVLVEEHKRHPASVDRTLSLGFSKTWMSLQDGAVYPVAPGVVAGSMDESQHAFKNFNYTEVMIGLTAWSIRLRDMNPKVHGALSHVDYLTLCQIVSLALRFGNRNNNLALANCRKYW